MITKFNVGFFLLTFLFLMLAGSVLKAQQVEKDTTVVVCAQVLKDAQKAYDGGKIYQIPAMLEGCLNEGFNKAEKLQALRLVILSYLFQDEDEKAENVLLQLLKTDPEYKLNEAIDPAEFVNLYNTYRTLPLINIGFKGGMNSSRVYQILPFEVDNPKTANGKYTALLGYQFGLTADILLHNKFQLSTDIMYVGKKYQYKNTILKYSNLDFTETQSWLELPVLLKYTFGQRKLRAYIQGGVGAGLLLVSSAKVIRSDKASGTNQAVGPDIDTKDLRKTLAFYALAGGGLRYKVGYGYVVLDARYCMGLKNIADPQTRYSNAELIYKYGYISDNFTINNIIVSIGYYKSIYKPKKIRTNAE